MAQLLNTSFLPYSPALRRTPGLHVPGLQRSRAPTRIEAKIREIFMPALSSTMTEGKIVSWVKSEGDKLSKGESVVVVESDKADMDVETFYDGYLAAIMVEEGGVAPVGSAIALLAESEAEIAEAKSKAETNSSSSSSAPPAVAEPEKVVENVGPSAAAKGAPAAPVAVASTHPASEGGKRIVASPYAKKLAKELNVELGRVVGSGPMGRIVAKDVEAAAVAPVASVSSKPGESAAEAIELGSVVPFTTMQAAVGRNMVESLAVPTFRVGYTITTNALDALYKKIKSKGVTMTALLAKATALALAKHPVVNSSCRDGKSFTYNSSINIAVAVAIDGGLITPVLQDADKVDIYSLSRKWKELVDKARAKQLQPQEYNTGNKDNKRRKQMGFLLIINGVDSGIVPLEFSPKTVHAFVPTLNSISGLQTKPGNIPGTFTLSNLGMFGVDRFDAILPPGTGAIMAVGASQPAVVATKDGRIGMKNQMQVNITADHRVIYGSDLASFLQTLATIIEDPKDLTF
ncbi:Dihydrolipoyllysine-residue acetyltransferase component of pyruvate dehydrogenase complex [Morella rubra]|uniref:Dihydrolipoamide acetyltransferase component of pyruvate dehydrogenase complex n=1 Tax=Morella rubra TaxID=262757 RepID=A0A6A1W6A5_9ROSI|nr:Dihydrolipoyllysine-residue acetyltransferase component of pyruvate dehydrogenase complex [Morella rubra]